MPRRRGTRQPGTRQPEIFNPANEHSKPELDSYLQSNQLVNQLIVLAKGLIFLALASFLYYLASETEKDEVTLAMTNAGTVIITAVLAYWFGSINRTK